MSKTVRGTNFVVGEKHRLIAIMKQLKCSDILENKNKDKCTLLKKKQLWDDITVKFNSDSASAFPRTFVQLQVAWQNIRSSTKKIYAEHRRSSGATGGGPPPAPVDSFNESVASIMGSTVLEPLHGIPDDDEGLENVTIVSASPTQPSPKGPTPTYPKLTVKEDIKDLQYRVLREKLEQQRELHAAQMDLIKAMKEKLNDNNDTCTFMQLLNTDR